MRRVRTLKAFKKLTVSELIKLLDKYTFKQLHIHHTWKPNHSNFTGDNHEALQQGMYNYHVNQLKWSDIGQHVTLMPDGLFVTGRDFNRSPASIRGWNFRAFAVEMLGNFDKGFDILEGPQKDSIIQLSRYFVKRFGKECAKFHNEGPNVTKTCPGTSIDKDEFMKEVITLGKVFKDVDDNRWSAGHIKAAKELGIIKGDPDGDFDPTDPLTREEGAVLMVRLYEKITGKKVV